MFLEFQTFCWKIGVPPEGSDEEIENDPKAIIQHVLKFVHPGITADDYKILKNFESKPGHTRHSTKILVNNYDVKSRIFQGCKNFRELDPENYLKKVFIKNDDPPMTRRENDRLFKKMKELREAEDRDHPDNKYHIKSGKLFKNGDNCIDQFDLSNQIF